MITYLDWAAEHWIFSLIAAVLFIALVEVLVQPFRGRRCSCGHAEKGKDT